MPTVNIDDWKNRVGNLRQFGSDLKRNAQGLPEVALSIGSNLAGQAGAGLGTLAGMTVEALRRKKLPDESSYENAAETIPDVSGRFTYEPRTEGGQATLGGLGAVTEPLEHGMQAVAEHTKGGPAAQAAMYTALNMLDPEMLLPGKATIQALRGASRVSRGAKFDPVKPRGFGNQEGAWAPGDIADEPGDFSFRSPTVEAFNKLKPAQMKQTQMTGVELRKALTDAGAKKEELEWMGLDKVLDTKEVLNVVDVKKLAENNRPQFDFSQRRSGGGTELDDEKVSEAARNAAYEDEDLQYPQVLHHREPGSRRYEPYEPASGETFDNSREMRDWLDNHKEEWVDNEARYNLENYSDWMDADEIAEFEAKTDDEKEAWARERAESSYDDTVGNDFELEADHDSEPTNLDELTDYHERHAREDPESYGLEAESSGAPDYGSYTVGRQGDEPEGNYTVATGRLTGEARFGKGKGGETPEFLLPYEREAQVAGRDPRLQANLEEAAQTNPNVAGVLEHERQLSLLPAEQKSKAFEREALRRQQVGADPNTEKYADDANLSHYKDMGKNQMYFTRETDRPAPDWGTVKKGVGRVSNEGLKLPDDEGVLPEGEHQEYNPLRQVEEQQSDWYQRGRKTGWADPKDLEKVEKMRVDKQAQLEAFKQQAVGEIDNVLRNPEVMEGLAHINQHNPNRRLTELLQTWEALKPGGEMAAAYTDPAILANTRTETGRQLVYHIQNLMDSDTPGYSLVSQTNQGLGMLDNLSELPDTDKLTPSGPMRETKQYTQLALADALRRAVQEGQQYLSWTPGDVHAQRWGTDSIQFAPTQDNPRTMRMRFGAPRDSDVTGTLMESLQERANNLLNEDDPANLGLDQLSLDDPEALKTLASRVEANLNYGMHEYPDPVGARNKRAELIHKQMEALSKAAQGGERKAAHYSPRAMGYEMAYGPMEEHLRDLLKRSGLEMPPVRDIPMSDSEGSPLPMRGFEIDPAVARAAKRGFILPY